MWTIVMIIGLLATASMSGWSAERVSVEEQAHWLRHVIPLPQEIEIPRAVELPAASVGLALADRSGESERLAAEELRRVFQQQAGCALEGQDLTLLLGVLDHNGLLQGRRVPGSGRLHHLPNSEQAYVIAPLDDSTLALAALTPTGVYYAARTLSQLLEPAFDGATVRVPLVRVVDWPDIEERGEWGGSARNDINWMSAHKMNLVEAHCDLSFTEDGTPVASADPEVIKQARLRGLNFVPIIHHLDYLERTGIFEHYPELAGEGTERADVGGSPVPICFSKPKAGEIIEKWLRDLAAIEGVTDVNVWLSEWHGRCTCPDCERAAEAGLGQHALETKVVGEALQRIRRDHPNFGVRVLLTQGSYPNNDQVLAAAPEWLDVSYYCGAGRPRSTYNSSPEPMIYPLLEEYSRAGNWLGVYPQFTASYATVMPWSCPQFLHHLIGEFARKQIDSVCGYTVPNNQLHEFNVLAAAEYCWNVDGRTPREFAIAWATRKGIEDAEAVGDWAELLGPATWRIYGAVTGAGNPLSVLAAAARSITNATPPQLGQGIWRYYDSVEQMEADVRAAQEARRIAERLEVPALVHETRVAQAHLQMTRLIWQIAEQVAAGEVTSDEDRMALQEAMTRLASAGLQGGRALRAWVEAIDPDQSSARYQSTVRVTESIPRTVAEALEPYGIIDPAEQYEPTRIGTWNDETQPSGLQTVSFEVTEVIEPGDWEVVFEYLQGQNGMNTHRVALASATEDAPEDLTELSVDEHDGFAGAQDRLNVYRISLEEKDATKRYFVVATFRVPSSSMGAIELRPAGDPPAFYRAPQLQPLTPEQQRLLRSRTEGPIFESESVRVAVLQGAYGSTSILSALEGTEGVEAAPLWELRRDHLRRADVVVVPQPRVREVLGNEEADMLRRFVADGGGVLATHDAVGYRGIPPIVPGVCRGGASHVRATGWTPVAEHPVTQGLGVGEELTHGYYDHVLLTPGPEGTVVAAADADPVVIAGEHGAGRYVATGLLIGVAPDDTDALPEGPELCLLQNAVRWLAGA